MLTTLLPLLLLVGVMFIMTRNAKRKQAQALEMRNNMGPGSGVRTIGGMYALVKSVNSDTVELEAAPGIHIHFAKNAIAAVLDPQEYAAIVHGVPETEDDMSSFEEDAADEAGDAPVELHKDASKALDLDKSVPATAGDDKVTGDAEDEGPAAK
ncbi:preprotein translocase subunit YajC [Streptomyces sp. NPDC092296]|uniref:preprotein translocase subunit YajC n=1 Tax=Streptomyces sp. NPDC092296 TaxID=3366012 RepID=UPI003813AA5A